MTVAFWILDSRIAPRVKRDGCRLLWHTQQGTAQFGCSPKQRTRKAVPKPCLANLVAPSSLERTIPLSLGVVKGSSLKYGCRVMVGMPKRVHSAMDLSPGRPSRQPKLETKALPPVLYAFADFPVSTSQQWDVPDPIQTASCGRTWTITGLGKVAIEPRRSLMVSDGR